MPEWTCGRCTFINHELMTNCEMCEAPREAAEIPYLGEQQGTNQDNPNPQDVRMEQTTQNDFRSSFEQPANNFASSFDQPATNGTTEVSPEQTTISQQQTSISSQQTPISTPQTTISQQQTSLSTQQTTQPSADDMLTRMDTQQVETTDVLNGSSMEANPSASPQDSWSLTSNPGEASGGPSLPEPMAPVVLHSLENPSPAESPMSEPEQINGAMCMSPGAANDTDDHGWSFLDNEVRIVMIGKTGVGKSTTGNNILGTNTFKSSASGASITKKCQLGWASRFNRDIQIIDTPGLFDTGMTNEDISREIVKCIGMTSPGPHAFLLVIRLDRFTAEEKATVEHFINIFGQDMLKYLVVLFTRMDDLKYDGTTLDEYLQNVPPDLKKLLSACQNRRIGFDNRGTNEEKEQDVQNLLKLIDGMVTSNGGGHYTNEMYEEAERIIAEQEEEHLKKSREKMKKEMARLREEVEEELRKKEEEKKKDLEQMKGKLTELGIDEDDEEWVQVFGTPDMSPEIEIKSITPQESQGASAGSQVPSSSTTVKDVPVEKPTTSEDTQQPIDTTDSTHNASGTSLPQAVAQKPDLSSGPAPMYQTDSNTGMHSQPSHQTFVSNEPAPQAPSPQVHFAAEPGSHVRFTPEPGSQETKSLHQREVEELRERKERLEAKHQMDKERMRADYMARQSAALHEYNLRHQQSRQRYRQEMHNTNSSIFTRFFGAVAKFAKNTTKAIGRGFQSLFFGVHSRGTTSSGHVF